MNENERERDGVVDVFVVAMVVDMERILLLFWYQLSQFLCVCWMCFGRVLCIIW